MATGDFGKNHPIVSGILAWTIILWAAAFAFQYYPILTAVVVICFIVFIFLMFYFSEPWVKAREVAAEEARVRKATRLLEKEAIRAERERVADLRDVPARPTRRAFEERILSIHRAQKVQLHPEYLKQIVGVMGEIYEKEYHPPAQVPSAWKNPADLLGDCFIHGLELAAEAAPQLTVQQGYEPPVGISVVERVTEAWDAIGAVARSTNCNSDWEGIPVDTVFSTVIPNWPTMHFRGQLQYPQQPNYGGMDERQAREAKRDYERAVSRDEKLEAGLRKAASPGQLICNWTLFYNYVDKLQPNFTIKTPLRLSDEQRFRHQFIVGGSGSGKTTLLSAQINSDLERVARGECSVFIMDSKNELIPNIAKLSQFAEGGPLENKLTYIEPNPEYPIALNIFEGGSASTLREERQAQQSALQLINFFLGSILNMDASGHQDTLLRYAVPAVLSIPNATLLTLKELLSDGGYQKFEPYFQHLRQAEWLKDNLSPRASFNISRNALRGRIESMLADDTFYDFFCKPESSINLAAELDQPRVVLINTLKGELPVTAGPLGCLFIAKLLQFTEQRTLQKGKKLPVFIYIDEASDYIANNAAVIELLNKARAQNVSFTFAIQGVELVSPEVLAALKRCNIQGFNGTGEDGTFDIAINSRPAVTVAVPEIDFGTMLHISDGAFDFVRMKMWKKYVSSPGASSQTRTTYRENRNTSEPIDAEFRELHPQEPIAITQSKSDDDFPTSPSTNY